MSEFIEMLEQLNEKDTKVRAVLRRSLAFEPGNFPAAYPFVEPFLKNEDTYSWRRKVFYLVAGLWAAHWRKDRSTASLPIGTVCAIYQSSGSTSTERRFISLLDADPDELPHRLRQMIALLKDYNLDFGVILTGLLYWNNDQKSTQNQWARDFYRFQNPDNENETTVKKEENA